MRRLPPDWPDAARQVEAARAARPLCDHPMELAFSELREAEYCLIMGDTERAGNILQKIDRTAHQQAAFASRYWSLVSRCARLRGDHAAAEEALQSALELAPATEIPWQAELAWLAAWDVASVTLPEIPSDMTLMQIRYAGLKASRGEVDAEVGKMVSELLEREPDVLDARLTRALIHGRDFALWMKQTEATPGLRQEWLHRLSSMRLPELDELRLRAHHALADPTAKGFGKGTEVR